MNKDLKEKKPEEKARVEIDNKLAESWWAVVDRDERSDFYPSYAVREFIVKESKRPDYLLFLNGKAIGVVEAKREENDLKEDVEAQADKYTRLLPAWVANYKMFEDLPISYITNGKIIKFKDLRDPNSKYVEVKDFHTPKELSDLLGLTEKYSGLPTLADPTLMGYLHENEIKDFWFQNTLYPHQIKAIHNIDYAFLHGKRRALLYLATGSGKTFTACNLCYRYLKFTNVKRILFLADRNNLCKQAHDEFSKFAIPRTGDLFVNEYTVDRLKSNNPLKTTTNVEICTIQRLFSYLSGKKIDDKNSNKEDEEQDEKLEKGEQGKKVILPDNPKLPKDFFDFIIVDECHRSIYSDWGSVLTYFENANIIGLTATPTDTTVDFFGGAPAYSFTYNDSIREDINCYPKIFTIKTDVSQNGGTIKAYEQFDEFNKKTGKKTQRKFFADDRDYSSNQLDVDVINNKQIELILATYMESLYKNIFTEREPSYLYIPKTLIFAKNENHAKNIVEIAKIVFKEKVKEELPATENIDDYMDKYVQRITYSCENSEGLINEFRTSKKFRIAVTVTLVATGTDIRPLESIFFMRDVRSEVLYEQMKGRGCRRIDDNELVKCTPNAKGKEYFYMIDAIGVCEHEKTMPKGSSGGSGGSRFSLQELFDHIFSGDVSDIILESLSTRLGRIGKKLDPEVKEDLATDFNFDIQAVSNKIHEAVNSGSLPEFLDSANENPQRKALVSVFTTQPALVKKIVEISQGFEIRLKPGNDHILYKGHALEEAKKTIDEFETCLNTKLDTNNAIKIIRDDKFSKLSYEQLNRLIRTLSQENALFKPDLLWTYYEWLKNGESPEDLTQFKEGRAVIPLNEKNDIDDVAKTKAVTNIIQLARYAMKKTQTLQSFCVGFGSSFNLWMGQKQRKKYNFDPEQKEFLRSIAQRICLNGAIDIGWLREHNEIPTMAKLKGIYGNLEIANEELETMSAFILRTA